MKRIFSVFCALCLLLGLCACGKDEETTVSGGSGEFCVAVCSAPDSLNPFVAESELSEELFRLVYDPLWRLDENFQPENCLVDSYDTSSDGLTWTIRLHSDIMFSDGEPLTSADVKFSWELFRQQGKDTQQRFDGIESIKCPDDYTVVITTSYVKGNMMYGEVPILPEHIWSEYSSSLETMDNSDMIGSGPFIYHAPELAVGETQQQWSLSARADYFAGPSTLDALSFRLYESASDAAEALEDGLVDACMGLTDAQLFSLDGRVGVEAFAMQTPGLGRGELMMNMQSGALADSVVREAVLHGLDREEIFRMGFGSVGVYGDGFIEPLSPFYLSATTRYGYDPSASAALLAGSLYQDYDDDGVMESRDNTMELAFRLYSTDDVWAASAATILTRDLEEIGIVVEWTTMSEEELRSRCKVGGDWDLCLIWREGSLDPQEEAALYVNGGSESGWQSDAYDALYDRLVTCVDVQQKMEICRELQSTLIESYPGAVIGYGSTVQAIRADRWMGYGAISSAQGGLFATGCIKVYMMLIPAAEVGSTGGETTEAATGETPTAAENATEAAGDVAPMATAVPLENG